MNDSARLDNGETADKITLKRGQRTVTYEKVPDQFAIRMEEGRVAEAAEVEAVVDELDTAVEYVSTDQQERLDLYKVDAPGKMEKLVDGIRGVAATDVVTHAYKIDDSEEGVMIPVGTLTVQFKANIPTAKRKEILAEYGLEILDELDYLAEGYTVKLTRQARENPLKIAAKLQQRPEIVTAEPDLSFQIDLKYVPTDTLYAEQWHLNNRGDLFGLVAGADVKAEAAWEISRGSRDIVVCVMDDGFDLQHQDLNGEGKIISPRDLDQDDTDPSPVFFSDNHGTACAGVAVAEENGVGVVGLAPNCAFMPIRMEMRLSDNAVVRLFRHAIDNGADVISCSWSATAWDFPLSTKISGIINHAATRGRHNGKGCVILFAAGNENRPLNDRLPDGRISHQGFALHPDVIAVAASNSRDERSEYSNFGPELAVCAPSSGDPGRRIVTTDRRGTFGYSGHDYTFTFGGTSSATPLAAGLAALILSLNQELTAAEVKQIMMETADKIDPSRGEYDGNGHSKWFGHGRINGHRALLRVRDELLVPEEPFEAMLCQHRIKKELMTSEDTRDAIIFPLDVAIRQLDVQYALTHERPQELQLLLETPAGEQIVLRDRVPSHSEMVNEVVRSSDHQELFAPVLGSSAQGDWQLRIHNLSTNRVGELAQWGMLVTY